MRRFILATCVAGICAYGCSRPNDVRIAGRTAPPAEQQAAGMTHADYVIGEPVSHENLTIFPISSKMPKNDDRFITLDEGLAAGSVKIIEIGAEEGDANDAESADPFGAQAELSLNPAAEQVPESGDAVDRIQKPGEEEEVGDLFGPAQQEPAQQEGIRSAEGIVEVPDNPFGPAEGIAEDPDDPFGSGEIDGDVNKLMVLNASGKPLYLMPGEVISGGKQDRTIGKEIVIASSDKPVPIDVFCVEQGRWAGRSVAGTTSQLAAAADFSPNLSLVVSQTATVEGLAKEAQRGKFVASVGQLNKDARLAVQQAGAQGKVWEEVARTNSKVGNDSESGNFAATYFSGEVAKEFEPFIEKLKASGETKQIVGVAVAVNGKMLSIDVFESTPLFKKFWPKLLKSYALDAIAAKSENKAQEKLKSVTVENCIAFLKDVEKSEAETQELADGQKIAKRQSQRGASFSYYDAKSASAAGAPDEDAARGFGGGGIGGRVHTSVLAH